MSNNKKILLTGVTGFLGSHTTIQLLNKAYQVIGTLRNKSRIEEIKNIISQHTSNINNLNIEEADLSDESIWAELTKGIDCILHIASPFPRKLPKSDEELILPAKNGTLNILKAASENSVNRVVIVSSSGAITYGKENSKRNGTFTEQDWTNVSNKKDSTPYFRSKTIAEKAAWDFIKSNETKTELTTVCPSAILGPVLEKDFGTSSNIVIKTLDGSTPAVPKIGFEMVDVRDVADLLIKAMEMPEAAGERFIGSSEYLSFKEVANILRNKYPERKIPKGELPNFFVKLFSNIETTLKPILIDLGVERKLDNSKAKQLLKWEPRSSKEAVLACAESVLELGIVK